MRARLAPMVLLAACVGQLPPQVATRRGPAKEDAIHRIVAVTPTCAAFRDPPLGPNTSQTQFEECSLGPTADLRVRSELAFRGYDVVDAELVNAVTARRHVVIEDRDGRTSTKRELIGTRFADTTPIEQAAILEDLHADAVLITRILLSEGDRHLDHVDLQLELRVAADQALVWGRRCSLDVPVTTTLDRIVEQSVRCAMEAR